MHGMLILLWIEDLAKTASDSDFIINTNWQWKRGNAWCWTLSHVYFGNFGRGAILIMSVLLFYITYGWRGLIFCFQKRLLQSKIFQARFRAFEVLLLRSFLYKRLSTRRKNTALSRFWKFYPNLWPDFEGNYFYTPKIGKQNRKKSPNS